MANDPLVTELPSTRFGRQLDFVKPEDLEVSITVIGVGGIGSPVVITLTKMGCSNVIVYDDDLIEDHNLPNQFYRLEDLGKLKVKALQEIARDFSGVEIKVHPERFETQSISGIVIVGVDNMKARKQIWEAVRYNPNVPLFIDARMGGEVARIYAVKPFDPDEIAFYEQTLYSDEEAIQIPCTAKAIIYNVSGIAAIVAAIVKKHVKGEELPKGLIVDFKNINLIPVTV